MTKAAKKTKKSRKAGKMGRLIEFGSGNAECGKGIEFGSRNAEEGKWEGVANWEFGMRPPAHRGLRLRPGGKSEKNREEPSTEGRESEKLGR